MTNFTDPLTIPYSLACKLAKESDDVAKLLKRRDSDCRAIFNHLEAVCDGVRSMDDVFQVDTNELEWNFGSNAEDTHPNFTIYFFEDLKGGVLTYTDHESGAIQNLALGRYASSVWDRLDERMKDD